MGLTNLPTYSLNNQYTQISTTPCPTLIYRLDNILGNRLKSIGLNIQEHSTNTKQ